MSALTSAAQIFRHLIVMWVGQHRLERWLSALVAWQAKHLRKD